MSAVGAIININIGINVHEHELYTLITGCIEQDPGAQKALYERYKSLIRSIVRRYIVNKEVGEELSNDIFYRIFTKIHLYKPTGSFEGWMKRLSVNVLLNYLKANTNEKEVPFEDKEHLVFVPPEVNGKFGHKELLEMIERLPDSQRIVFNLFVFEGYSHKEIAGLLGINEGNSKWHLNSARNKLKQFLINEEK